MRVFESLDKEAEKENNILISFTRGIPLASKKMRDINVFKEEMKNLVVKEMKKQKIKKSVKLIGRTAMISKIMQKTTTFDWSPKGLNKLG
jgi:hypothetical protein